jgi:hypothetical protein
MDNKQRVSLNNTEVIKQNNPIVYKPIKKPGTSLISNKL